MQDVDDPLRDEGEPFSLDKLAQFVQQVEDALAQQDYATAASLVEENIAATWFGFEPART